MRHRPPITFFRSNGYPRQLRSLWVWTFMLLRFSERVGLVDNETETFLTTIAYLGGYCTVDQALRLGLATSNTRVHAQLSGLEQSGFLKRIADYPLVYQITKSVTRLMGCDIMARRAHPLKTIGCRLLAVNFYIEAVHWPAEFIFDQEQKIGALEKAGCPEEALPHRGGRPHLWENLLIKADRRLCIAMIDRAQGSPFLQAWGFAKRYFQCLRRASNAVRLLAVVNSEAREKRYRQVATHPKLQKLVWGGSTICLTPYKVQLPVPFIHSVAKSRREER